MDADIKELMAWVPCSEIERCPGCVQRLTVMRDLLSELAQKRAERLGRRPATALDVGKSWLRQRYHANGRKYGPIPVGSKPTTPDDPNACWALHPSDVEAIGALIQNCQELRRALPGAETREGSTGEVMTESSKEIVGSGELLTDLECIAEEMDRDLKTRKSAASCHWMDPGLIRAAITELRAHRALRDRLGPPETWFPSLARAKDVKISDPVALVNWSADIVNEVRALISRAKDVT